jgi:hypothetical protein
VWRLEALLRSLPLGSQSRLVCDGRTHPGPVRRGQLPELRGLAVGVVAQGGEHDVGQFPFQAAQGFAVGFAGGSLALVVGAAFGVAADLGDRDRVERAVELPVPAGIEPVPHGPPGGGGQRGGAVGGGEGVAVGVAADIDELGEEPGCDQRPDAVQVGQRGAGGGDQIGELPLYVCCLGVDGENPLEAAPAQYGAGAVVVGDQGEHDLDPGAGGQVGDLVVVAGVQAAELGMGPVDQGSPLGDQVLAVVEQGSQVSGRDDSQLDRRQLRFTRRRAVLGGASRGVRGSGR